MRSARIAIWLGLCLVLASCSGVGLVYNHLDTAARLQLGRYVDFTPAQRDEFNRAFQPVWDWHRRTQLPLYAEELQALAQAAQAPLDPAAIAELSRRSQQQVQATLRHGLPAAAGLLAGLSDTQVQQLLQEIDRRRAKRDRRQNQLGDAQWAEQRADKAVDQLKDWAGTATPEQRQRIRLWAAQITPLRHLNGEDARQGRERFAALLQRRQEPGFDTALEQFLLPPETETSADGVAMQQATQQLLADLSRSATTAQRAHLRKRLLALATEMQKLSRDQPGKAAA